MAQVTPRNRLERVLKGVRDRIADRANDAARSWMRTHEGEGDALPRVLHTARIGDPVQAQRILSGRWSLGGIDLPDGTAAWSADAPEAFRVAFERFDWLLDLAAHENRDQAASRIRTAVNNWIANSFHSGNPPAGMDRSLWDKRNARRILSWLAAADLVFKTGDPHGAYARADALQAMIANAERAARVGEKGRARLDSALAWTAGAACFFSSVSVLENSVGVLEAELEMQILLDGGHISRSPEAALEIAADLIGVRAALNRVGMDETPALDKVLDRIAPFLRSLMHADGALGAFQGGGAGNRDTLFAVLERLGGHEGRSFKAATHSGFSRITVAPKLCLIVDDGQPVFQPWGHDVHAPGAIEISDGFGRVVVNSGAGEAAALGLIRRMSRTDRASTLRIRDLDAYAGEDADSGRVETRRSEDEAGSLIELMSPGFRRRTGLSHRRRLFVDNSGTVRGDDRLFRALQETAEMSKGPVEFTVQFILHPDIDEIDVSESGRVAVLSRLDGPRWVFRTDTAPIHIEKTMHCADGPASAGTHALVIRNQANPAGDGETAPNRVRWSFSVLDADR